MDDIERGERDIYRDVKRASVNGGGDVIYFVSFSLLFYDFLRFE
jgi:hypothetical protein